MMLIAASRGTRIPGLDPGMDGPAGPRIESTDAGGCERGRRAGLTRASAGLAQACGEAPATASIFQEFGS